MQPLPMHSYSDAELKKFKDEYAKLLAAGTIPVTASCTIFHELSSIAIDWEHDSYVLERKNVHRLNQEFAAKNVYSKELYLLEVQQQMLNVLAPYDYRYKMFHLFARTSGFVVSETGNGRSNQIVNNGLLIMSDCGTDEEWERDGREQQMKLLESVKN